VTTDTQIVCPNCHEDLSDTNDLELFDVIECDNCGVELEVVSEDPVALELLKVEDDIEPEESPDDEDDKEFEE
jgi:alpha-aminoadipate carrier protein LysW